PFELALVELQGQQYRPKRVFLADLERVSDPLDAVPFTIGGRPAPQALKRLFRLHGPARRTSSSSPPSSAPTRHDCPAAGALAPAPSSPRGAELRGRRQPGRPGRGT